jgi:Ca2+-binding RTX toxin-like protein
VPGGDGRREADPKRERESAKKKEQQADGPQANVSLQGDLLTYGAQAGRANDVRVHEEAGRIRMHDSAQRLEPGEGCKSIDAHEVSCTPPSRAVVVATGDLADSVDVDTNVPALVLGGEGNDVLRGGDGPDGIVGCGGQDRLYGGAGADNVTDRFAYGCGESASDDVLDGGPGPDSIEGGHGEDTVDYSSRGESLTVSVAAFDQSASDGGPSDGPAQARDRVGGDVENVLGGSGDDVLSNGQGSGTLAGNGGDDRLNGGIHADRLVGGAGDDTLSGSNGADSLFGETGQDRLWGGNDDDTYDGGAHRDRMSETVYLTGTGVDLFYAGSNDSVEACGPESGDRVIVDGSDTQLAADCDSVSYR